MAIYLDDLDRGSFLQQLADVVTAYRLECHAYCLMTNHYHLVVRTLDANISRAIKHLNGPYAQRWNARHARVGHVFQGRFHAQVIQDEIYLLVACRYVVRNPVRAGLVTAPGEWPWSSYCATAALAPAPSFLSPCAVWRCLGNGSPETALRYRHFVTGADADDRPLSDAPVLGDDAFIERFRRQREQASPEVPRCERQARPTLDRLFTGAVTRATRDRRAADAYASGYSMADVARYLQVHPSTVSKMVERSHRIGS
jgi:REP element-mobilizing transposase RayT